MSTIDSSVTKLLVATKRLLESLTAWSRRRATEKDVSDIYVTLGNELNIACRAFSHINMSVQDLGNVPGELRTILERTLSQEACQATLDRYLPEIRHIILNLLQGLRRKQSQIQRPIPTIPPSSSTESHDEVEQDGKRQFSDGSESQSPTTRPHTAPSLSPRNPSSPQSAPLPKSSFVSRNDPLVALQQGEALERRASRRYSAYQTSRMTSLPSSPTYVARERLHGDGVRAATHSNTKIGSPLRNGEFNPFGNEGRILDDQIEVAHTPELSNGSIHEDCSKSFTLFLQLGRLIKKVPYEGSVTIPSLRLLFIDVFSYSPGSEDFPEIFLQDPTSGVHYQLDDMADVKSHSVLSLNIEPIDQVKRQIDSGLATILDNVQLLSTTCKEQGDTIQSLLEMQQTLCKKITESESTRSAPVERMAAPVERVVPPLQSQFGLADEVSSLKGTLAGLRRLQKDSRAEMEESVAKMQAHFSEIQMKGPIGSRREKVEKEKNKLEAESKELIANVESLQDTVEALRKDVAQRGIRPRNQSLESARKRIATARHELQTMAAYMSTIKPEWKVTWEKELNNVCEEQAFFNLQEEFAKDLLHDLENANATFMLVEQCSEQQLRGVKSAGLRGVAPLEQESGKDAVLSEVRALQPDHNSRLEAIRRVEKARAEGLEERSKDAFEEELGNFVQEGRLKNSGGVEEAERQRSMKDELIRKDSLGLPKEDGNEHTDGQAFTEA